MSLHEAARDNKPDIVSALLSENPSLASSLDDDSRTPLHWACTMQHSAIVCLLLPHIGEIDDLTDEAGWTPVHIAAAVGSNSILELLMAHDPQPDINLPTSTGATALHVAVSKGHVDTVHLLIDTYKCSVRAKDKMGRTALHRAAAGGSQPLVKRLVAAGAVISATDKDGWTALHHALAEGHGDVAVLLVQLCADTGAADSSGATPVDVANEQVRAYFTRAVGL